MKRKPWTKQEIVARYLDLRGINLQGQDLIGIDFNLVNLSNANLFHANLLGAKNLWLARVTIHTTLPDGTKWSKGIDMQQYV